MVRLTRFELVHNPLDDSRTDAFECRVTPSTRVADLVPPGSRVIVTVDGDEVPESDWPWTPVAGRSVRVQATCEGGVLRTTLQIAILGAALFIGGLPGAAIAIAGNLALNALIPPPTPDFGGGGVDPVYSLNAASSRARLYETLPLVIGKHRVVADLSSSVRTFFQDDEQYLEGIWHFGLGSGLKVDEATLQFGDIAFSDLEDVEYEIAEKPGLVGGNVDTVAGAELSTAAVTRQASPNTTRVEIDLTGQLFEISKKGKTVAHSVTVEVTIGDATHTVKLTHDSQSPLRRTYGWDIADGAAPAGEEPKPGPAVSVRRTKEPSTSDRVYDTITWAAMRSIQPDTGTYTGQTRIAVRVRASGQLQGTLPPLVAECTQRIAGAGHSNPAAILQWYALGVRVDGKLVAGIGMEADELDAAALGRWSGFCAGLGLECNAVLSGGATHDETLRMITSCGRARLTFADGKMSVMWEDPDAPATMVVTPGNIVQGSFVVHHSTEAADEVVLRFVDPDLDWALNSVRRGKAGPRSITVLGRGITNARQAAREATRLLAAESALTPRMTWGMGREGGLAQPGAVALVTHDLIGGGETGRLRSIADGTHVELDAVGAKVGDTLVVVSPDGTVSQREITAVDGRRVTLDGAAVDALDNPEDTIWRLYSAGGTARRAWIKSVELTDDQWTVTAVQIQPAYAAALKSDGGDVYTRPEPGSGAPEIVNVTFTSPRLGLRRVLHIAAVITTSGDWRGATVLVSTNADYSDAAHVATLSPAEQRAEWAWGDRGEVTAYVEIRPVGGEKWRGSFSPGDDVIAAPTDLALQTLPDRTRVITWSDPEDDNLRGILLRYGVVGTEAMPTAWEDLTAIGGPYTGERLETALPPKGTWAVEARSVSEGGFESGSTRIKVAVGEPPEQPPDAFDDTSLRGLITALDRRVKALEDAHDPGSGGGEGDNPS